MPRKNKDTAASEETIEKMEFSDLSAADKKIVDILYDQENYEKVLKIIPNNPEPIYLYAMQLIDNNNLEKDMDKILECYEKLKKLDPAWAAEIASKLEITSSKNAPDSKLKQMLIESFKNGQLETLCRKHKKNEVFADVVINYFEETPLWIIGEDKKVFENEHWARIAEIWFRNKINFTEIQNNMIKEMIKKTYDSDLKPDHYDHYIDRYFKNVGIVLAQA